LRYLYADVFLIVNFCFDLSLLYLAGRLGKLPVAGRRLVLGALVGALYGTASLFPQLAFLMSLPAKTIASFLMVALAYPAGLRGLRIYGRVLALFYLVSFVAGGAALAWNYVLTGAVSLDGGLSEGRLGVGAVAPAVVFGVTLLHWALVSGRKREQITALCVPCRVVVEGREVEFRALIDTGNRLRDPISDAPVVIVEYPAMTGLLPPNLGLVWIPTGGTGLEAAAGIRRPAANAETGDSEPDEPNLSRLTEILGGTPWLARIRLIPFSSLGRSSGLLIGFRPDAVVVGGEGRSVRRTDVVVCLSPRPLSSEGSYRALLPPEVLEAQVVA
jgi:stage II sporulation protein GA (sporulation sigma-E factor processing peptidase)